MLDAEPAGHLAHLTALVRLDQRDADAGPSRAAGAADTVDVGLVILGRIEVDHVGDARHVDSARGDVSGHQRVDVTGLKAGQSGLALALGLVAVHRDGLMAARAQALDQPVGAALGAHEDQSEVAVALQLADQGLDPVAADGHEAMLDLLGGAPGGRAMLVLSRVVGVLAGDASGLAVQRGGEEQRLALGGAGGDDPVHGGAEAHVEHPVGLVEDQRADVAQVKGPALELVLQAARGGHDDVALGGVFALFDQADPAVDGGDAQSARVSDVAQVGGDLRGQLARRGEDQRGGAGPVGGDPVDERDPEGQGLARAGGGPGQDVAAVEDVRQNEGLHGEGFGDTVGGERAHDGVGHAKFGERRHKLFTAPCGK